VHLDHGVVPAFDTLASECSALAAIRIRGGAGPVVVIGIRVATQQQAGRSGSTCRTCGNRDSAAGGVAPTTHDPLSLLGDGHPFVVAARRRGAPGAARRDEAPRDRAPGARGRGVRGREARSKASIPGLAMCAPRRRHRSLAGSPTGSRSRRCSGIPRAAIRTPPSWHPQGADRADPRHLRGRITSCLAKSSRPTCGPCGPPSGPLGGSPTRAQPAHRSPDRGRSREDLEALPDEDVRALVHEVGERSAPRDARRRRRSARPRAGPRDDRHQALLNEAVRLAAEAVRDNRDVIRTGVRAESPGGCPASGRSDLPAHHRDRGKPAARHRRRSVSPLRGAFERAARLRRPPAARPRTSSLRRRR